MNTKNLMAVSKKEETNPNTIFHSEVPFTTFKKFGNACRLSMGSVAKVIDFVVHPYLSMCMFL